MPPEFMARIQADAKDRAGLRHKLVPCIDPMDLKGHPESSIFNIVSGKLAPASDLNAVDSIVIALLSNNQQDVDMNAVDELAPVSTAVFMTDGMRI